MNNTNDDFYVDDVSHILLYFAKYQDSNNILCSLMACSDIIL